MLYILKQYLLKSLPDKKRASKDLVKNNLYILLKLYPKLISKADIKLVTVNIVAINAINTHFYLRHKENKAFLTSIYKIDYIL
jgi:hypothetical protein